MNKKSVGYRFRPTDEEIVTYFLEGKMSDYEFPEHPIFEIDFRKYSPSQLPQMSALPDDQVGQFFSAPSYKHLNSKRADRSTSDGYWKVTGKDRPIRNKRTKEVIGMKKTLVFYKGRSSNAERTNWVMHEFHSSNAHRYPKEFVFCRVKRKNDDNYDASQDEPSNLLPSTSGTPAAADNISSQLNHQPPVKLESHDCYQGYVILQPQMQTGEGPSHANRSNSQRNLLDNQLGMRDLDDSDEYEWVESLWAKDVEVYEETVHAHPRGFTPTKPLRGQVFVRESSETVTQTVHAEFGHVLRTPSLCNGNASSKESEQMQTVHYPSITPCSSNSESDINFIDWVLDEFPTSTRTCKSQHLPISHNFKKESAPKGVQLQGNVSRKAVSRDKAIDFPQTENSIVKLGEDQKTVQTTHTKTNLKLKSSVSDGNNGEILQFSQSLLYEGTNKIHH